MFFPHHIKSIRPGDKVLEIGPGATPHPRANEFLEYRFLDSRTALVQRGNVATPPEFGQRKVTYYDGNRFPFPDNAFDYVIASHVVEHTPDPSKFMAEVFRVGGGRGYLEFPLPPYEYLFDLDVHLFYVWYDVLAAELLYVRKQTAVTEEFSNVTAEFRRSLELGWDDLVRNNLPHFVQGFEFAGRFTVKEAPSLKAYQQTWTVPGNTLARKLVRKLERLFERRKEDRT